MITREEAIARIVLILYRHEDDLSDGYGFYCGSDRVHNVLYELACEIYDGIAQG